LVGAVDLIPCLIPAMGAKRATSCSLLEGRLLLASPHAFLVCLGQPKQTTTVMFDFYINFDHSFYLKYIRS
jgi:hypothetical protein